MAEPTQVNVVDVMLVVTLLLFALEGLRRGFVGEVLDLAGLALAGAVALEGYQRLAPYAQARLDLPQAVAELAAFFGLFLAALLAFALVAAAIARVVTALFPVGPLRCLNSLAGAAPGLLKGVVLVALLLRAATLLPLGQDLRAPIAQSRVAGLVGDAASRALPHLEDAFDRIAEETSRFAPPVKEGERHDLNLPRDIAVQADPDSEAEMLRLVNQERVSTGLSALVADPRLREVARAHGEEMFRLAYFAHDSPLSGSPFDRLRRAGIGFTAAGENLAYAPTVEVAHRGLMNSPEHKRNILAREFQRVGIGVVRSSLWGRMFTQDFAD